MKIGFDLDCVLNNSVEVWIQKYNKKYYDNLTIEDIYSWEIANYVKCSKKEMFKLLNKKLFKSLSPIPHSVEVTKELSKHHELFVVTATYHKHAKVKIEWLLKHFPHIKEDNIIITHRKDMVNVDLLVDDGAHNIETFPRDTIVLDYAWNRYLDNTYKRAKNLLEVKDIIDELNNKSTPFYEGYRPNFYFRTSDVSKLMSKGE